MRQEVTIPSDGDRLGSRLINMGWRPRTSLRDGLAETYAEYLNGSYRVQ